MGIERPFSTELLVLGVLRSPDFPVVLLEEGLGDRLGPFDWKGPELPFEFSSYYEPEMGPGILRSFYAFARLVDPAELADIKRKTDRLEEEWAMARAGGEVARRAERNGGQGRPVNLDPGLLSLGRFILATTKDRSHRVPLRDGIYAELTLRYQDGAFRALPWTYPDWQSPAYLAVLGELRTRLKAALRAARKTEG